MEFDSEHKVQVSTMSRDEARDFLIFLRRERVRHQMDWENAVDASDDAHPDHIALSRFWASAANRHAMDVSGIDALEQEVRQQFKL